MYKFRDINDASVTRVLPSEALQINGEYIEDLIPGYRTLYVIGREALSPELDYIETSGRDGAIAPTKRYPPRTIKVGYQLLATSNMTFRDAYNALGGILDVEDAELIFNDEQDKFFIGTPSGIGEVEPGRNSVISEIEFTCIDPFKYSINEYEAPMNSDGYFDINYGGTYKSFPKLEATFFSEPETDGDAENELTGDGDCGYVAFFNDNEKIIQMGDPDETDGEDLPKAQTLTTQAFTKSDAWSAKCKERWKSNQGIMTNPGITVQTGAMGLKKPAATLDPNTYYLTAANYGSGTQYHGAAVTRTLPADKAGEVGAKNFKLSYRQKMAVSKRTSASQSDRERGMFQALVTDANGVIVAGVVIFKNKAGQKGKLRFIVNNKIMQTMDLDLSAYNQYFGSNTYKNGKLTKKTVKASTIKKAGTKIVFQVGGIKKSWVVPTLAGLTATKVTFGFYAYGTYPALEYNGIYNAKFVKNNCDTWAEVPNKFSSGDVVTADCNTGEIFLNDAPAPDLGAMGNDWENFYLQPGLNQIGVSYSDWVTELYKPTFKIKYREAFL